MTSNSDPKPIRNSDSVNLDAAGKDTDKAAKIQETREELARLEDQLRPEAEIGLTHDQALQNMEKAAETYTLHPAQAPTDGLTAEEANSRRGENAFPKIEETATRTAEDQAKIDVEQRAKNKDVQSSTGPNKATGVQAQAGTAKANTK